MTYWELRAYCEESGIPVWGPDGEADESDDE
jgi:hypothetical protein